MKRFSASLAVATLGIVVVAAFFSAGCNDYNNTFQSNTGATLTFIAPTNAVAGGPAFTLTVNGFNFVKQTVVQWNGKNLTTTPVTDSSGNVTSLTAQVTATMIGNPGTAFVQTVNPHSGSLDNGLSNVLTFTIQPPGNPTPTITSLSPNTAVKGGPSFTLAITGTGFVPTSDPSGGSVVHWNNGPTQTTLTLVSVSSTQIQAAVSSGLIASAGTATVTVFNPSPGGGVSGGQTFTITSFTAAVQAAAEDSPAIGADGRYVAYAGDDGDNTQIFVRDTCTGAEANCQPRTVLVSAAADGAAGNNDSHSPSISTDGRYVAFSSAATNLVSDAPAGRQVYLRDTCFGATAGCKPSTQLISIDANGALSGTENILPSVSASGRFVAFLSITPSRSSGKSTAKSADTANSGFRQVFVRDTCLGAASCTPSTARISLQPGDAPPAGDPARPALSGTAKHVALAGRDATLFTRGTAIDDRVFLALTRGPR